MCGGNEPCKSDARKNELLAAQNFGQRIYRANARQRGSISSRAGTANIKGIKATTESKSCECSGRCAKHRWILAFEVEVQKNELLAAPYYIRRDR